MAHPDLMTLAFLPDTVKKCIVFPDLDKGTAKFALVRRLYLPAQLPRDCLLAVTNAKYWETSIENDIGYARCICLMNAGRTTRQDHCLGRKALKNFGCLLEGNDFTIDPGFSHAPGNQLGNL